MAEGNGSVEVVSVPEREAERTAEILLARLLTYSSIEAALVQEHGLTVPQARGVIGRVRDRWAEEEPTSDRLTRRRQLRGAIEDLYRDARSRKRVVEVSIRGADGSVVVESKEVPDPDRAFCLRAVELLARLEGLFPGDLGSGGGGAASRAAIELEEGVEETRHRLEAWLGTLPDSERGQVVETLLRMEEAARGSTAAFVTGQLSSGGAKTNGHANGNGKPAEGRD